jgi:hypothetical protein
VGRCCTKIAAYASLPNFAYLFPISQPRFPSRSSPSSSTFTRSALHHRFPSFTKRVPLLRLTINPFFSIVNQEGSFLVRISSSTYRCGCASQRPLYRLGCTRASTSENRKPFRLTHTSDMASVRPAMHARDSSGRQVSLLNDEPTPGKTVPYDQLNSRLDDRQNSSRSNSYTSESPSPKTPDLLRSDSYDSRASNDLNSPLTPSLMEYARPGSYNTPYPNPSKYDKRLDRSSIYGSYPPRQNSAVRPSYAERNPSSYEDNHMSGGTSERTASSSGKRYACRFKDSHGCDKSFTTSGHASRHAKIHTAEKAVHCTFQGCQKKFTRADNMKQHLETHYKERSRSSTSHKSSTSSTTKLTMPAGVKKSSLTGTRISRPTSRTGWPEQLSLDTSATFSHYHGDRYSSISSYGPQSPATSPKSGYGALDMGSFQNALPAQYLRAPGSRSAGGLDALALAVASQTGN